MTAAKTDAPNCYRCSHFFVTWEMPFGRGCRALGFKARGLPCDEVKQASGKECQAYQPKKATSEQADQN